MTGVSIETTLELWASSLRDVKARMRPLFTQERVAVSAGQFLGLCRKFLDIPRYTSLLCMVKEGVKRMAVEFKGAHFPKDVILYAVFFYVRYPVSYRELQEILAERGIRVDHATLNRWVIRYSPRGGDDFYYS
ncbi:hypothetical protein GGQ79_004783 [Ochrobactrum pecoris]|uniref:Transposase n=1 Tax=Brucella pecoris TaxID=867683 RepID=A0AB34YYR8_9HYPH|nr:hypothetical protein [Brucella pecoris]